jgi:hypothetical protein
MEKIFCFREGNIHTDMHQARRRMVAPVSLLVRIETKKDTPYYAWFQFYVLSFLQVDISYTSKHTGF